jgi:hypothetical protein
MCATLDECSCDCSTFFSRDGKRRGNSDLF